ncbi:hypothetical protein ACFE04_010134 [Oxalis oulophora]
MEEEEDHKGDADDHHKVRRVEIDAATLLPNFFRGYLKSLAEKFHKQEENDEKSRTEAVNVDDCHVNNEEALPSTSTLLDHVQQQPTAGKKVPDAEQKEDQIVPRKLKEYLHTRPSEGIIWSGCFQMLDFYSNKVEKPYGVFHAQLPCRVNRKASELSKHIPLMLHVKLVPRKKISTKFFDLSHIAMYFIPSDNIERSKKDFTSLFELMESRKSVMLGCINGVDLMIFTSKQLPTDAQENVEELPSPLEPASDCLTNIDDDEAADMEIDTIEGEVSATTDKLKPLPVIMVTTEGVDFSLAAICWVPPPAGWVKLNIEGYFHKDRGFSTAVGTIRDASRKWVLGYSFNLKCRERLMAEMHALFHGISTLWDNGYKKVLVESSLKEAVEYIEARTSYGGISERCIDLMNRDWNCGISYINSQANMCANWLATHPQDCNQVVIFWKPPLGLLPLYQNDGCL